MIVDIYGTCPNCEHELEDVSKFCPECGTALEWKTDEEYFQPKPLENIMRHGTINCSCGQSFYFETNRLIVHCIKCNKEHDISKYPVKE